MLKVLPRITEPTEGYAEIHGRVGSPLEVGTGFHPELTGRENIYLNGAILGMKKAEIDRKFDEIVGFAEIEKFIRHACEALLYRHVCSAGLRRGRSSGAGDLACGRGVGSKGYSFSEKVSAENG